MFPRAGWVVTRVLRRPQTVKSIAAADGHLWLSTTGDWLGLMLFRVGGLYAETNAAFTTHEFTVPQDYLWLNMDSRQAAKSWQTPTYIMVGLLLSSHDQVGEHDLTGAVDRSWAAIPGFEPSRCVLAPASEQGMPLRWLQDNGTSITTASLVGQKVRARVELGGGATVYSLGAGATWSNQIMS